MAYKHGISTSEIPTSITPSVTSATLPVVFGTAPVNMSKRAKPPVNEPVLCYTYAEAVEAFGYSEDWSFTLSEFMNSYFALFGASPVVLVNVLDPAKHKKSVPDQAVPMSDGLATIKDQGVLKGSVKVKKDSATYEVDKDYALNFNGSGELVIQRLSKGTIPADTKELTVSYDKLDPAAVKPTDIIGGIDSEGRPTGLELINQIFPRFRMVPGMVLAPGFSSDPTVAAVLTAKVRNINGSFKCMALTDIPANMQYTDVPKWTADHNYTSPGQINCYPKLTLGDKKYHLSSQLAGVMCVTDAANGGVPYMSPSNHNFQADGAALNDGTEVLLGPDQASFLNGNGIVTALNFIGGWKAWGNRTGAYPGVTDPKDAFIPVRRMMDWIQNTVVLTYWQYLDAPVTKRMVQAITDSLNLWMNSLQAQGYILGGRVEFLESENPKVNLMDGKIKFHIYVTPPSPAEEISFVVEYDANYLSSLFAA
ncbi:phage tail sheath family protein [Paenibacillus azoreducens]|uniref:phage tail sheath family protein n=1 Tax=Paenibacillus azoreducens TaxID=116718 RepID=UPI0039F5F77E